MEAVGERNVSAGRRTVSALIHLNVAIMPV